MQTNWDAPVQIFLNLCSSIVEDDRRQQRQESRDLRYFLSIAKGRYAECSRLVAPEYRLSAKTLPIPKSGSFMTASSLEKTLQAKQRGWKRRYERYRTDFLLKATVLREGGYEDLVGRCGDIGRGGMGAVFTTECVKGEVISLEFRLPTAAEVFSIRSIVRYRRGFLHGLEFLGLTDPQRQAIDEHCAQLTPSP